MDKGLDKLKIGATALLLVAVVVLVFVFFPPMTEFRPGTEVNEETFTHVLEEADRVNIMMDIRGVDDEKTQWGILQCGIDFAGSFGLATKNVSYLSMDDQGCVAEDGRHNFKYCTDALQHGVTLYIREGSGATFHSNAMVVGVGNDYVVDSCKIEQA